MIDMYRLMFSRNASSACRECTAIDAMQELAILQLAPRGVGYVRQGGYQEFQV